MKKSQALYFLSIIVGILGILQLVSAWMVEDGGSLGNFSQGELYINALLFMVIAIWLAHGVIINWHNKE